MRHFMSLFFVVFALVNTGFANGQLRRVEDNGMAWRPEVADAIDAMIAKHSGAPEKPVAVFDWDNTLAKHDISDAVFYKMLKKNMMFAPPGDDLSLVTHFFTDAASAAIKKNCERFIRKHKMGYRLAGSFYRTEGGPKAKSCRLEFLSIYDNEQTTDGKPAFHDEPNSFNRRRMKPSYAWIIHTLTGMSRNDIMQITNEVIDERTTPEAKARRTQNIDGVEVAGFLEIYKPMATLIDTLIQSGFDVWVVSASNQYVVETFAHRLDQMVGGRLFAQTSTNHIESESSRKNIHVVGVQVEEVQGAQAKELLAQVGLSYEGNAPVLTNRLKPCGPDGVNQTMTYIEGKSCFIDTAIFGGDGRTFKKRPVFVAGDATTDIAMLQSASSLALAMNRNYNELMCNAYQGDKLSTGKKWVIQPMFIDPCPKRTTAYDCNRCVRADGSKATCINEQSLEIGGLIEDTIYVENGSGKLDLDCHR